ncbi:MAG: hypothetical protein ACR2H1_14550 [Limisphaerales bacterium]
MMPAAMIETKTSRSSAARFFNLFKRILILLIIATLIGWLLNRTASRFQNGTQPAGFARGVLHGALMPLALPNLLVGQDVTIYAVNNTGRTYKLGYTTGVNGCGAIFFGFFFWRVNRWKKKKF